MYHRQEITRAVASLTLCHTPVWNNAHRRGVPEEVMEEVSDEVEGEIKGIEDKIIG